MISRAFFLIALVTLACAQGYSVKVARAATAAPATIDSEPVAAISRPEPIQRPGFIAVEGPNLRSRMDAAVRLGRAASARFWTAYAFDVRPGVSVDADWNGRRGSTDGVNVSF